MKVLYMLTKGPYRTVLSTVQNVTLYSYKELRIATENFSPANKIGQGGFGSVYKVSTLKYVTPSFSASKFLFFYMHHSS